MSDLLEQDLAPFFGPNAGYVLDLYEQYQSDPSAVDAATRAAFENWKFAPAAGPAPAGANNGHTAAPGPAPSQVDTSKIVAAARIARLVRELGHLTAHIDPLGSPPPGDPDLELGTHGLTTQDLEALPASVIGGPLAAGAASALDALGRLRKAYSGPIGYEDDHIQNNEERTWLREAAETGRFYDDFGPEQKRDVLERLTEVETLERFIHQTFIGAKRFSIEGVDMLIPIMDSIIHDAAQAGTREVVIGMAHRGRLNALAHILGKPYASILEEFQTAKQDEAASVAGGGTQGYAGDVKYHLGARRTYRGEGVGEMPITLTPNPSHLEFVDPVVEGRARAAQETRRQPGAPVQDRKASLAVMIHGDAAFPGQGIVAETLNLSRLRGYGVGGTIHVITNNQIGFTTTPDEDRSTLYASDLAKGFEIPIVHVNADDPAACIAAARLAHAYRERFGKDFLIDLVGYRRFGHNEGEEPAYTQPRMYEIINQHPTVREIWAKELEREGLVTRDEAAAMVQAVREKLQKARAAQPGFTAGKGDAAPVPTRTDAPQTGVAAETLRALNDALFQRPAGFTPNAKEDQRIFQPRKVGLDVENGISWAHAESLAFASILADGTPIRLTGQDSEVGTFSHRHSVLHDPTTGEKFTPLQHLPHARASFAVYNSPLSENAALGFEYGYSIHATEALVLWEAQYGDFANGAQVIIDQFLVSGNSKWQQTPSLVLLLPHGYEGGGSEHSSARLERFLQLASSDNIRVVNCSTAAQYFHLLRRQAAFLTTDPRPLVVMAPKSQLRVTKPPFGSSLSDLTTGQFQPVLDDAEAVKRADKVTRLILCSGKVYVDLVASPQFGQDEKIAAARVEELYPFPSEALTRVFDGYPNLREIVWLQEEPRNQGAWFFAEPRLRGIAGPGIEVFYVGRPKSASTAEGSKSRHDFEQARLIAASLTGAPEARVQEAVLKPETTQNLKPAVPATKKSGRQPEPVLNTEVRTNEVKRSGVNAR